MTFPAEALVFNFFCVGDPLWWYSIDCSLDHSNGSRFYHLSLSDSNPFPSFSEWPRSSPETQPGTNFSESRKVDNVASSLFRDFQFKNSVFLFDSMIFSNHLLQSLSSQTLALWHILASPIACLNCHTQHQTVLTTAHLSPNVSACCDECWWEEYFSQSRT